MTIYAKLDHRADLYKKQAVENDAGQLIPTWVAQKTGVRCGYSPVSAMTRVSPTYEQREKFRLFFKTDAGITYDHRVLNIKDRYSNIIATGPFEVISILLEPGFTGKAHHAIVEVRRVIENA